MDENKKEIKQPVDEAEKALNDEQLDDVSGGRSDLTREQIEHAKKPGIWY